MKHIYTNTTKRDLIKQIAEDILPLDYINAVNDYDKAIYTARLIFQSQDLSTVAIQLAAYIHDKEIFNLTDTEIQSAMKELIDNRNLIYTISLNSSGSYWDIELKPEFTSSIKTELLHYIFPLPTVVPYSPSDRPILNQNRVDNSEAIKQVIKSQNNIQMRHTLKYGTDIPEKETRYAKLAYESVPEAFYFDHKVDFRGRLYNIGYDISYQGTTCKKAQISFAKPEILTSEGLRWLKIDIANHFGMDKLTFDERVKWFDTNYPFDHIDIDEKVLTRKVSKKKKIVSEYMEYKLDRALIKRSLEWYEDAISGKPVPAHIYLDATASFLQIYSILLGDKQAAKLCNIASGSRRADIYTMVANELGLTRKDVKKPLMTMSYGKLPKGKIDEKIYDKLQSIAPAMIQGMNAIYNARPESDSHSWTLPDGFKVNMLEFADTEKRDFKYSINNTSYTFSYSVKPQEYNPVSRALSPNVVHSVDAYIVRRMISELPFDVTTIHDSFACHPNNASSLIKKYREIMVDIFKDKTLLSRILTEIAGEPIKAPYIGTLREEDILNSEHILS